MPLVISKEQYKLVYELEKKFLYECKEKMIKKNYHSCPEWNDFRYSYIRSNGTAYELTDRESGLVLIFFHYDAKFSHYNETYKTQDEGSFIVSSYHTDNADDSADKFYILTHTEFESFKKIYFK